MREQARLLPEQDDPTRGGRDVDTSGRGTSGRGTSGADAARAPAPARDIAAGAAPVRGIPGAPVRGIPGAAAPRGIPARATPRGIPAGAAPARGVQDAVTHPHLSAGEGDETGERAEQRGLARTARAHHGDRLARIRGERDVEPEPAPLHADARGEPPIHRGHRGVPGRHARTSSSTATAVIRSSSASATAVPCGTPAPLNAV